MATTKSDTQAQVSYVASSQRFNLLETLRSAAWVSWPMKLRKPKPKPKSYRTLTETDCPAHARNQPTRPQFVLAAMSVVQTQLHLEVMSETSHNDRYDHRP